MIIKCGINDQDKVISYIGKDYHSCLYLYLDLKKYGIGSNLIDVYIQYEESCITSVMLIYYSCLHIYSKDNLFNSKEILDFIHNIDITIIYCKRNIAQRIYNAMSPSFVNNVSFSSGWVAKIDEVDKKPKGISQIAADGDFIDIVKMIYSDEDIGKSYRFDELTKQIKERNKSGYVRNIVIKKDGVIIAHACTNAEYDNIAVVAELIVNQNFRHLGYASEIWRDLCNQLILENKEVYSFYYSKESRTLHQHIGFKELCEWTKIVFN